MAAEDPALRLPFGFARPGADDFGRLGRAVLDAAEREIARRTGTARWLLVPALLGYLLFALGVGAILLGADVKLPAAGFVALVTVSFLAMAVLGQYYQSDASWTAISESYGRVHAILLAQALLLRLLTAAFFVLPYRVLRTVADLFPRRPHVDRRVLTTAVQLAAALDQPIRLDEVVALLPREAGMPVVEEAVLLLLWAGVATVERRAGGRVVGPTAARGELLDTLPRGISPVVLVSDLRRPGGGRAR